MSHVWQEFNTAEQVLFPEHSVRKCVIVSGLLSDSECVGKIYNACKSHTHAHRPMCHHICVSKFMLSRRKGRACDCHLKFKTSNGQSYARSLVTHPLCATVDVSRVQTH